MIQGLHNEGMTILLVEQNVRQALQISQRGYVIETGKIKLSGTSEKLMGSEVIRKAHIGI